MSKYTTQVRFICEQKAGLEESTGANNIDTVISESWNKIFTTTCEFFDENYRKVLCSKILKHYYMREIGAETVGLWAFWMNSKLEEIMPYYNQLYLSAKIEFSPLDDVNVTREHNIDRTNKLESGGGTSGTSTENRSQLDLYSDTPQGAVTNLENQTYLTNASKNTAENSVTNKTSFNNTDTGSNTESFSETVKGKQGSTSYSEMLIKYRETMLNIDMMVINEFQDLFFLLW